jgi:hypothetical protein
MTISRENYERERGLQLRLIRTTRDVERKRELVVSVLHPTIMELNVALREDARQRLVDLRYAYYHGMDDDTPSARTGS